ICFSLSSRRRHTRCSRDWSSDVCSSDLKELIARAIHNASSRKGELMIKVNCAAMPANLIESELFGHEKGAFTGAIERRIGKFEQIGRASCRDRGNVGEVRASAEKRERAN